MRLEAHNVKPVYVKCYSFVYFLLDLCYISIQVAPAVSDL